MKKILFTFVLLTIITPSIALASWWNPFSWFNSWSFSKKSESTEVLQERIKELEDIVEEKKQQQIEADISNKANTPVLKEDKASPVTNTTLKEDAYSVNTDNLKTCNGVTYNASTCLSGTFFYCPTSGTPYCKNEIKENENLLFIESLLDSFDKQKSDKIQVQEDMKNSERCILATKDYDSIQKKISQNLERSGDSSELAELSIKSQPITDEYYRACYGTGLSPSKMYQTNCSSFGNIINCSTY